MTDETPAPVEIDNSLVDVAAMSPHGEALGLLVEAALTAGTMGEADDEAEATRLALREGLPDGGLDCAVEGDPSAELEAPAPALSDAASSSPATPTDPSVRGGVGGGQRDVVLASLAIGPPNTGRRVGAHMLVSLGLAIAAMVTAAAGANGSLHRMDGWGVAVLFAALVALFAQIACAFPTMRSARPPTKLLLVSSALPFALAAFSSATVFPRVLRDTSANGLRAYPMFLIIAATVGAAAFVASALALRSSIVALLPLVPEAPAAASSNDDGGDERAETRALFAVLAGVGGAIAVLALLLVFGLPMNPTVAFYVLGAVLLGFAAQGYAQGKHAIENLAPSALRDRLVARVTPLPVFALGGGLLLGLSVAMGVRFQMLSYLSLSDAESAARASFLSTAHAVAIDRALLLAPLLFAALATAGFWLPAKVLPSTEVAVVPALALPGDRAAPPVVSGDRAARRLWIVAIAGAMLGAGMLLRMEDLYERRIAPARDRYLVELEKSQPT